jgi:hypothetical protein
MNMLTIKDLTISKELDTSEMSAVRGALCVDVGESLKQGFRDSGFVGLIGAAAACLDLVNAGVPVCTD